MWLPPGTLHHCGFWPRCPEPGWSGVWGLGISSMLISHLCLLSAADNMTKIFGLLREYEPHGPLVRSWRGGQSELESG